MPTNPLAELIDMLADIVTKCTDYGSQEGGFVAAYIIPTGPIHRAIPLLAKHGIVVRPHAASPIKEHTPNG